MPDGKIVSFRNKLYSSSLKEIVEDKNSIINTYTATKTFTAPLNQLSYAFSLPSNIVNGLFFIYQSGTSTDTLCHCQVGLSNKGHLDTRVVPYTYIFDYNINYLTSVYDTTVCVLYYYTINGQLYMNYITFNATQGTNECFPVTDSNILDVYVYTVYNISLTWKMTGFMFA